MTGLDRALDAGIQALASGAAPGNITPQQSLFKIIGSESKRPRPRAVCGGDQLGKCRYRTIADGTSRY